jgi:hypothetical protein
MVERFTGRALAAPDTQSLECPFAGLREPTTLGAVFEANEQAASQGCLRLANTFGIDNRWTQYCRWAASRYESGRRDLIREIWPSEIVMAHVRDELEPARYQPAAMDPQPRPRARPPRFACKKTKTSDGILQMEENFDLAELFRSRSPFPDTYPAELAARFPP